MPVDYAHLLRRNQTRASLARHTLTVCPVRQASAHERIRPEARVACRGVPGEGGEESWISSLSALTTFAVVVFFFVFLLSSHFFREKNDAQERKRIHLFRFFSCSSPLFSRSSFPSLDSLFTTPSLLIKPTLSFDGRAPRRCRSAAGGRQIIDIGSTDIDVDVSVDVGVDSRERLPGQLLFSKMILVVDGSLCDVFDRFKTIETAIIEQTSLSGGRGLLMLSSFLFEISHLS